MKTTPTFETAMTTPERPTFTRWTPRRKAAVIYAIQQGHITERAAHEAYGLSTEELTEWLRRLKSGIGGLKVSRPSRCKGGTPWYQ